MANQLSLMAYVQHGFQRLPIAPGPHSPQNTRHERYNARNINSVGHWADFNLASIQQQFSTILAAGRIIDEPFPTSPPGATETVQVTITDELASYWCEDTSRWVVLPGVYDVFVGTSTREIHATLALEVRERYDYLP